MHSFRTTWAYNKCSKNIISGKSSTFPSLKDRIFFFLTSFTVKVKMRKAENGHLSTLEATWLGIKLSHETQELNYKDQH